MNANVAKNAVENGYNEFKEAVNKSRRTQGPRIPIYTCEQLCGRVNPCGNRFCSNYRGPKKR